MEGIETISKWQVTVCCLSVSRCPDMEGIETITAATNAVLTTKCQ